MNIRAEEPLDYSQIASITYEAFSNWHERPFRGEPCIVDALRSGQFYDPELALVAEDEAAHTIAGHAFFSFLPSIVLGEEKKGAYLAPLTVAPAYQRQGVGTALMEEGIRIAREKGIAFILLCGHPGYYGRFGFQSKAFALQGCLADLSQLQPDPHITERPVRERDLPWLTRHWKLLHMDDLLAFYPGDLLMQWYNHSPRARASVFEKDGEVLGYARYSGETIKDLVALDGCGAAILRQITGAKEVALPFLAAHAAKMGIAAREAAITDEAFFMLNVDNDPLVARYLAEGQCGVVTFPSALDLDE